MFKNVVVGTDGSPSAMTAVHRAAAIAAGQKAALHIVTAYQSADMLTAAAADPLASGAAAMAATSEDELRELARSVGAAAAQAAAAGGAQAETYAVAGTAADVLLDMADSLNADLVVVGNRGMRGARRFLGSVPNTISHRAPCAVLIVQTT